MVETVYRVPDVSCDHCVRAITGELSKIEGVENVDVNIESKMVRVRHDASVADAVIVAGIGEAGYDVAESRA
jgi:copper chaperone CopZ